MRLPPPGSQEQFGIEGIVLLKDAALDGLTQQIERS